MRRAVTHKMCSDKMKCAVTKGCLCSGKTIYQGIKKVRSKDQKDLKSTNYIYNPKYVMLIDKS